MARADDPYAHTYKQLYAAVFTHFARTSGRPAKAIAHTAGCTDAYVSMIAKAERLPTLDKTQDLDRALNADGCLYEVRRLIDRLQTQHAAHGHNLGAEPQPSGQEDAMERRALLQLLAALGAGTAVPGDALETLRQGLDTTTDAHADNSVDEWERSAWEYGHSLVTVPAAALVGELAADVVEIRSALKRTQTPIVRDGLHRVSAQLAAAMAMCLLDLGDPRASWRWWRTARHAADASGDLDLRVWMRAREAHNGRYASRHETIVTRLNNEAITLAADHPSAGLATALANRAHLSVALPDGDSTRTAVRDLEAVFGRLPANVTADTVTQWGWSESAFHNGSGGVYARLGDTKNARTALDRAEALCPPDRYGARAQISLRHALCDVREGDVSQGLDSAVTAVSALPSGGRTRVTVAVARDVLNALPEKARALPAARELRALTSGQT